MWTRRTPKNRRLEREHVLGVRMRVNHARAARFRMAAVALLGLFVLVAAAAGGWYGWRWGLQVLIYQNKAFAIREIDLRTDGVIAVDQLRRWSGVKPGANLFAVDLAQVKQDLQMVPLIELASVERIPPHTLRILVHEREPVAQINIPRPGGPGGVELTSYYIDAAGYIMMPLDPRQRAATAPPQEPLPMLRSFNPEEVQPGRRVWTPQVAAALQLLAGFARSSLASLVDLKSIDLSSPDVLVATTDNGAEITFGLADLDRQLRRWQAITQRAQGENKVVATLDLAVTNYIPVRWFETNPPVSLIPRIPRPPHVRRTHV